MRNVWIEGAVTPFGKRVIERLVAMPEVERIVAIEPEPRSDWDPRVEWVQAEADHRGQLALMCEFEIDTVIQCTLASDRMGGSSRTADVIGTLRLGAAIAHEGSPVRAWVLLSSSAVYPIEGGRPLYDREDHPTVGSEDHRLGALLEAEDYAIDIARHTPHLNVAILRLQELVGDGLDGPLARHFRQSVVPLVPGYDPPLQFLHARDAVDAVLFAAEVELAGCYNVASRGVMRQSECVGTCGARPVPSLPVSAGPFKGIAERVGLPSIAPEVLATLRFGQAIDTAKIEAAGFKASADQFDCVAALRARRD